MISSVKAVTSARDISDNAENELLSFLSGFWEKIPLGIAAVIVFIIFLFLASAIKKIVVYRITARAENISEQYTLLVERLVYYFILTFGVIVSFKIVGINLELIFGVISLGIGFALKDSIANFIGGMMILSQKQFKPGDTIKIADTVGIINKMDVRTTEIKCFDGTLRIIPNADMLTNVIQNYNYFPHRRIDIEVGVHYQTDLSQAATILVNTMGEIPEILKEPSSVVIATDFADSAITLSVRFWVDSDSAWLDIKSRLIQHIQKNLEKNNIIIPFPIRTLGFDAYDKNLLESFHSRIPQNLSKNK